MRLTTLFFAALATASPLSGASSALTLGLASWDIEGYAKDNPIGPTTGGAGGKKVTVSNAKDLLAAVKGDEPKTIYVKGSIELPERLQVGSNKSILGLGWNAHIKENGITVNGTDNVIIRNLKISYIEGGDCIAINNATRVWVDHNEFESEISVEIGPDFYVSVPLPNGVGLHTDNK